MSWLRGVPWARRSRAIAAGCGLFGKLPQRRDFVRAGVAWPAFERWLEGELEVLGGKGEGFGDEALRVFLPALDGGQGWGVLLPSQDALGRRFPLALFLRRPRPGSGELGLAAAWRQQARFFVEAEALLVRAQEARGDDLDGRLTALAAADGIPRADAPAPVPASAPVFSLPARAVFAAACEAGRTAPALTVEAPAVDEATRAFWLGLVEVQGQGVLPAVLAGPQRMVLGFAARGVAAVLAAHGLGPRAGSRHWVVLPDVVAPGGP